MKAIRAATPGRNIPNQESIMAQPAAYDPVHFYAIETMQALYDLYDVAQPTLHVRNVARAAAHDGVISDAEHEILVWAMPREIYQEAGLIT